MNAYKRRVNGEGIDDAKDFKIFLTPAQKSMTLAQLQRSLGMTFSKASHHRAWRSGYLVLKGYSGWKQAYAKQLSIDKAIKVVKLSKIEKLLPVPDLALRRGISYKTAKKAIDEGYFLITKENEGTAKGGHLPYTANERLLRLLMPSKKYQLVVEENISEMTVCRLIELIPWMKAHTAEKAIERGYINTVRGLNRKQRLRMARRLKELQEY